MQWYCEKPINAKQLFRLPYRQTARAQAAKEMSTLHARALVFWAWVLGSIGFRRVSGRDLGSGIGAAEALN